MSVSKTMMRGWLQNVDADLRCGEPFWREIKDGNGTTLVVPSRMITLTLVDRRFSWQGRF